MVLWRLMACCLLGVVGVVMARAVTTPCAAGEEPLGQATPHADACTNAQRTLRDMRVTLYTMNRQEQKAAQDNKGFSASGSNGNGNSDNGNSDNDGTRSAAPSDLHLARGFSTQVKDLQHQVPALEAAVLQLCDHDNVDTPNAARHRRAPADSSSSSTSTPPPATTTTGAQNTTASPINNNATTTLTASGTPSSINMISTQPAITTSNSSSPSTTSISTTTVPTTSGGINSPVPTTAAADATTKTAPVTTPTPATTTTRSTKALRRYTCTIRLLLLGRCRAFPPLTAGRPMSISFNHPTGPAINDIPPREAAPANFQQLVDTYQPRHLTLRRTIFHDDLMWVLEAVNWTSVETLRIRGLVSTTLALTSLNHFPNLRHLNVADNGLSGLLIAQPPPQKSLFPLGALGGGAAVASPTSSSSSFPSPPSPSSAAAAAATAAAAEAAAAARLPPSLDGSVSAAAASSPGQQLVFAEHLEVLDARNNSLFELLPQLLRGMRSLRVLNLTENYISTLHVGTFRDTRVLEHLWLSLNHLTQIEADTFNGLGALKELTLEDNQLTSLEESLFRDLTQLRRLILSNNVLRALPPTLLSRTGQLIQFEVVNSFMETVPETLFVGTPRLRRLLLFNGRLTYLPPKLMEPIHALEYFSLSGNRITALPPDLLRGLHNITDVYMNRNRITAVPEGLFRDQPRLRVVGLGWNRFTSLPDTLLEHNAALEFLAVSNNQLKSLPGALLHNKPLLFSLYLNSNQLTRLDIDPATTLLPALSILDVAENPVSELPPPSAMPNITTLRLRHHHMRSLPLTPLLSLRNIERLELPADPQLPPSTLDFSVEEAQHDTAPPNLKLIDMENVVLTTSFVVFATQQRMRLRHVRFGWPEMSSSTAPVSLICNLLDDEVDSIGIHNTAYQHIDLCKNKRIRAVSLRGNRHLRTATLLHNLERLNVSGCTDLESMTLLSARILDISHTRLVFQAPLCDTWGTRALLASGIRLSRSLALEDVGAHIQRCLSRVEVLDLSQNTWLNQVRLVETPPIVLSDERFWSEDFAISLTSNSNVPVFIINAGSVSCTVELGDTQARARTARQEVTTEVTFQFHCRCARRFVQSGDRCVPDELSAADVVAISLGVIAACMGVLAYVYQHYRRRRRTLEVENKEVYTHLLQKEEEVLALKKAWEIEFSELRLVERIDSESEGAFGEVWLAKWDELAIATKILKRSVLMFDETTKAEFEKEVEFLQRTRHPHVVRFFGAGTTPQGSPFLVLEYIPLGSLQALLRKELGQVLLTQPEAMLSGKSVAGVPHTLGRIAVREAGDAVMVGGATNNHGVSGAAAAASMQPTSVWALKVRLAQDIACGMAFIHRLGHVHRDLKSANVLVSRILRAKISDFGCIREVLTKQQRPSVSSTPFSSYNASTSASALAAAAANAAARRNGRGGQDLPPSMTAGVGTPLYMAPEVLAGFDYDSKADVFSFGVLLWEIATQQPPDLVEQELGPDFTGTHVPALLELLSQGKRLKFPRLRANSELSQAGTGASAGEDAEKEGEDDDGSTPEWYADLSRMCVVRSSFERPSFDDVERRLRFEYDQLFMTQEMEDRRQSQAGSVRRRHAAQETEWEEEVVERPV